MWYVPLLLLTAIAGSDFGYALYKELWGTEEEKNSGVSVSAHFNGFMAGIVCGILFLKNLQIGDTHHRQKDARRKIKAIIALYVGFGVVWNASSGFGTVDYPTECAECVHS